MNNKRKLIKIRRFIMAFAIIVALSGITAFPVEMELKWLLSYKNFLHPNLEFWLIKVYNAVRDTNSTYGFLLYGYDWLAFAHLMIALLFIGPYKDPQKNIWVIEWAMLACFYVIPLALIAGAVRGIPLYWRLIDCSFGVVGIIPLWICRKWIKSIDVQVFEKGNKHRPVLKMNT